MTHSTDVPAHPTGDDIERYIRRGAALRSQFIRDYFRALFAGRKATADGAGEAVPGGPGSAHA